jgi:hypothetical protein
MARANVRGYEEGRGPGRVRKCIARNEKRL